MPGAHLDSVNVKDSVLPLRRTFRCCDLWLRFLALTVWIPEAYAGAPEFKLIPAGAARIGDNGGQPDERPAHSVYLSPFYCDVHEVTTSHWEEVAAWAEKKGYVFDSRTKKAKKGTSWSPAPERHPMNMVSWYDAVKWCNARSESEGRAPAYYVDSGRTQVYRAGTLDLGSGNVDWDASGYRLPTEAEWEKDARGGASGFKYPWGNLIDGSNGNYRLSGDPFDNASTPVGYYSGSQVIEEQANSFGGEFKPARDMANGYGLYDVLGNVNEWCWDWYRPSWYGDPDSLVPNPHALVPDVRGPATRPSDSIVGGTRVARGGSFQRDNDPSAGDPLRLAYRHQRTPDTALRHYGFRCVRADVRDELWYRAKPLPYATHGGRWMNLEWFGNYFQSLHEWIYHESLGWAYPTGEGSYDNWIFFPDLGWCWTHGGIFPYLYSPAAGGSWLWYNCERKESGWFYHFREKSWMCISKGN